MKQQRAILSTLTQAEKQLTRCRRHHRHHHRRRPVRPGAAAGAAVAVLLSSLASCTFGPDRYKRMDLGVDPKAPAHMNSAAYRDTIGAVTFYEGLGNMRVSGYGLVVGLGRNGSTECPKPIFDRLVREIEKQYRSGVTVVGATRVSPERLIRDPDTAVVMVTGDIPPGAVAGQRFDVAVTAIPGTETKSLRGGRLYTCELTYSVAVSESVRQDSGRTLALGAGPIFTNPFSDSEDAATVTNPLEGVILGGGLVTQDRRVQLVLTQPSHGLAAQIERRINAEFSGGRKVADAVSPAFIRIDIPERHHRDAEHFLALLRHLYLPINPGFAPQRVRELADEMVQPDAPHADISLCFEGLGQGALPALTELYTHSRDFVSFHAAAAGLRLEDPVAVEIMAAHAHDAPCPFRYQAIRALGRADHLATAATPLRRLLADDDSRVRIAAYKELARRGDMAVAASVVGEDGFFLDVVKSPAAPLIYARRGDERRLAVFGAGLKLIPPVFYVSPENLLTVSADDDDSELTIIRRSPLSGSASAPIPCSLELVPFIELLGRDADEVAGQVRGLGLDYGMVVHALYSLCLARAIGAEFVLEEDNAAELFGPPRTPRRPESEL